MRPRRPIILLLAGLAALALAVRVDAQFRQRGRSFGNIRAGQLPEPESNGTAYLKIPLDALGGPR